VVYTVLSHFLTNGHVFFSYSVVWFCRIVYGYSNKKLRQYIQTDMKLLFHNPWLITVTTLHCARQELHALCLKACKVAAIYIAFPNFLFKDRKADDSGLAIKDGHSLWSL
jgi:hypothetical protein